MSGWFWIVFWWVAFAATHVGLSALGARRRLIERLGENGFLGVYSVISLATFIPLLIVYFGDRNGGGRLWNAAAVPGLKAVLLVLAGLAFALVIPSVARPSPMSFLPGERPSAQGMMRITRHPLDMSLGLWGLAHALVLGYLTDVLFFGGFVVFVLAACAHQDARKGITDKERLEGFFAETSLLPFGAIARGRNHLVLSELPWVAMAVGVTAAIGMYLLHPVLFE